jgi:hypothetical protein
MNPSPDFPDETGDSARGGTNGGKSATPYRFLNPKKFTPLMKEKTRNRLYYTFL